MILNIECISCFIYLSAVLNPLIQVKFPRNCCMDIHILLMSFKTWKLSNIFIKAKKDQYLTNTEVLFVFCIFQQRLLIWGLLDIASCALKRNYLSKSGISKLKCNLNAIIHFIKCPGCWISLNNVITLNHSMVIEYSTKQIFRS